jgi:O-Antigen ligase
MDLLLKYRTYSREIYFWSLTLLAVSLLFLRQLMVAGQVLLLLNWLLEGNLKHKLNLIYRRKSILIFSVVYLVHLIWLVNTSNFSFAFDNILMKIPLLILPVVIGTSDPLPRVRLKQLMNIFILAVLASTIISTLILFGIIPYKINDIRDISIFISHIRFSLCIVMCMLILFHWIISEGNLKARHLIYLALCLWFFYFLVLLKSLTGIIILLVTVFLLITQHIRAVRNQFLKIGLIMVLYAIPIFTILYLITAVNFYLSKDKVDFNKLDQFTKNGHRYINDTVSKSRENGHYVWLYFCPEELEKEWSNRSNIRYDGADLKSQPLKFTLIRYMTSKGLRKDSAGVSKLSVKDISNIENGISNVIFSNKGSIFPRVYEVIWELDEYVRTGYSNGHSVTQRFVYSKIAYQLFASHPLFGIGTGDVKDTLNNFYKTHDTGLTKEFQRDIHNEYLRLLVPFGIVGFLLILSAFIIPPILEKKWSSYYFVMIFIILFLSFISEDTLETQVGVTFAAFFYSLFLWGTDEKTLDEKFAKQ